MPKSKIILCLGLFIAILPKLGFPYSWAVFFEVASGLAIVLLSVLMSVDKRLVQKAKAERRQERRRSTFTVGDTGDQVPERVGRRASDVTVERRRAVRFGRRATDVVVETVPEEQTGDPSSESSS